MKSKRPKPKPTRSRAVTQPGAEHPAQSISLSPACERLKELDAFKKEHGHCNVPSGYSANLPLARWVSYVRHRKRSAAIALELADRLDRLGFTWVCRRRAVYRHDWDAKIAALAAFKNQHGHCCVPLQPAEYRALATWLIGVRRRKKKGLLDRERTRQLDKLGVVWELQDHKWEDRFAELVAYRAKYGNCNVPGGWPENPRLASWVYGQRYYRKRGTLAQDRHERLDKIGFVWTRADEAWESNYAALVEYRRTHGHCRVSPKDHASLGKWVYAMRGYRKQGKLSEERIRRLTRLGFAWEARKLPWKNRTTVLVEYKASHGNCEVPTGSPKS